MDLTYKFRWQHVAYRLIDDLIQYPSEFLPGMRVLGKRYKVSILTIEHALAHLEELGVVASAQPGKRRKVNPLKLKKIVAVQNREENRIVFLSPSDQRNHLMMAIYAAFHELCNQRNLSLSHLEFSSKVSDIRIQLATIRPKAIILYMVSKDIEDVALSLNIPAVVIGTRSLCFPAFSTVYSGLLIRAFQHAWEAGHRRISTILWNPEDSFYDTLATQCETHFPGEAATFSRRYNLPRFHGETSADYQAGLRNLFRYTPPSCLILLDLSHYLAASSFFLREGLRIPDDISVIILLQDPLLDDIVPSVAHFRVSPDDTANQVFNALQKQMEGLESHEQTDVISTWVPGDSLKILRS